jgi:GTP-binding protein
MRQEWQALVEGYLSQRPTLRATVVIIDIRREPIPESDIEMIEYLRAVNVPWIPVLTKADKLSRNQQARMKKIHANSLPSGSEPVLFSAVTGEGLAELQKRLAECLG